MLTNEEARYLLDKGEVLYQANKFSMALDCYSELISNAYPNPYYFKKRALIYRITGRIEAALNDLDAAIDLDPDDSVSYWERGACYAHRLSMDKEIDNAQKKLLLKKILADYKRAIERNPASAEAWLAIVETNLLLQDWDGAISEYGACKPYVDTKEYQLIRSWLGCLSLAFAGDSLEEDDTKYLFDSNIRLGTTSWCISEIDSLFSELVEQRFNEKRLNQALEIQNKFIEHFDEPPIRAK